MEYIKRIRELEDVIKEMLFMIDSFSEEGVKKKLFDEWSLREVLLHLNGWNELRVDEIDALLNEGEIPLISNYDHFNADIIENSESVPWEVVRCDFEKIGADLVEGFLEIPSKMHDIPIWEGEEHTPDSWLNIDLDHHKSHKEQIESAKEALS